jgi:hypothetical protein
LKDGVKKLEVQPVVAGRVRNALSDGKLEEASDAVEVGVHPRNLGATRHRRSTSARE